MTTAKSVRRRIFSHRATKPVLWAFAMVAALSASPASAASILAKVDISDQRMEVYVDGIRYFNWAVSTGRSGYQTPVGAYEPQRLEAMWHSRKYNWAPMPSSIFFHGGYAIHGTDAIADLGQPASHGCVRLHPDNAAMLFELVRAHVEDTEIIVTE